MKRSIARHCLSRGVLDQYTDISISSSLLFTCHILERCTPGQKDSQTKQQAVRSRPWTGQTLQRVSISKHVSSRPCIREAGALLLCCSMVWFIKNKVSSINSPEGQNPKPRTSIAIRNVGPSGPDSSSRSDPDAPISHRSPTYDIGPTYYSTVSSAILPRMVLPRFSRLLAYER